jgi:hypothetical protein
MLGANNPLIFSRISNTDRSVGAMLSGVITKLYGEAGLPENTLTCKFEGSAGQSFGAFLVKGIHVEVIDTLKLREFIPELSLEECLGQGLSLGLEREGGIPQPVIRNDHHRIPLRAKRQRDDTRVDLVLQKSTDFRRYEG